jgi:hypothetical protein
MSIVDQVELSISQALQKGIKAAGTMVAGYASTILMKKLGMQLDASQQVAIAVAVTGALTSIRNILKQKFPAQLGWL